MNSLKKLEEEVGPWANISVHLTALEVGNSCLARQKSDTCTRAGSLTFHSRDQFALLAEGLAEEHHWVPNSGWITFRIRSEQDIAHALWLMRLWYLRYALKEATDPRSLLEHESENYV